MITHVLMAHDDGNILQLVLKVAYSSLVFFFFFSSSFGFIAISFTDCKFNCHRKCSPLVPNDCAGELPYDGSEGKHIVLVAGSLSFVRDTNIVLNTRGYMYVPYK